MQVTQPQIDQEEMVPGQWPEDVGILALEFVTPPRYVDQSELEEFDGVSGGKYTIGLGQDRMAFCTDREDINSICLTALSNLMTRNNLSYSDIGRLEVGTETLVDKSKSVKSVLMQLFEGSNNHNVEGIDTTNACYGGTAALFNSVAWIESSSWDGRLAVVIAADIAVYAKGNARPTGGAGAVAILVGPNAPLIFERGVRGNYMAHAYDFYKPDLTSEYPVVDGKLSISCYLKALDGCYDIFTEKLRRKQHVVNGTENGEIIKNGGGNLKKLRDFSALEAIDGFCFHSPYCKLVHKGFARVVYNDFLNNSSSDLEHRLSSEKIQNLEQFRNIDCEKSYVDRDLEKTFIEVSKPVFAEKTEKSLFISNQVGNMYTAALYGSLISYLISKPVSELEGKRVGLFSYGSGLASSMFSLLIKPGEKLENLVNNLAYIKPMLDGRRKVSPTEFENMLNHKEKHVHTVPFNPVCSTDDLSPGTWYLESIDAQYRRFYSKVTCTNGNGRS